MASIVGDSNAIEQSFIAPLVKESLLLGATSSQTTIIVGERGHILVSEIPNSTNSSIYTQIVSPTKVTLTNVYSINNLAWAVGHDATIIKSTDAGLTWTIVQSDPELDRPLLSIYFFDESEGVAVGAYGLFYRSLDGGNTWIQERHPGMVSEDDNEYLNSIKQDEAFYLEELSFISPHLNQISYTNDTLYIAGEAGLVARSLDKGRSWERIEIDYQGSFFDIGVLSPEYLMTVGLRGNMFVLTENETSLVSTCITTSLNRVLTTESKIFVLGNNGVILSIDKQLLMTQGPDSIGDLQNDGGECVVHPSVTLLETDFSDAILTGILSDSNLLLVTAAGLKTVVIEE
jgi:photosystem II stability/assembly factor-like uncharacterized protein